MNGLALKELARALAVVVHADQSRKGTGEPYMTHVDRVAESVKGWRAKTIAYLHDTVEDTAIEPMHLLAMGFRSDIVDAVLALTKLGDWPASYGFASHEETYREFIKRAIDTGDPDVIAVKLADVADNLRDIDDIPHGSPSMRARYELAHATLVEALYGEL